MFRIAITILIVLVALGVPAIYSCVRIGEVEKTFGKGCVEIDERKSEKTDWTPVIPSMQKHSELLISWAIAIAGGIVALITTTSLHQFQMIRPLYLVLVPALSLIIGSLSAAVVFQSRASYIILNKCADSEGTLNDLLLVQTDLFQYSVATLVLFAVVCLTELISGTVTFKSR